jgi:hypothetical protein
MKKLYGSIFTLIVLSSGGGALSAAAQIAAGGTLTLEQSVIAGGGGQSAGGAFTVAGTTAQPVAGTRSGGAAKSLHGGFWNSLLLAPTAARFSVSGRVLTAGGRGIRSVTVILTEGDGRVRTAVTGAFGYYHFAEIGAGQTIVVSVKARRYAFAQPSVVLNVTDNAAEIDFIAADF